MGMKWREGMFCVGFSALAGIMHGLTSGVLVGVGYALWTIPFLVWRKRNPATPLVNGEPGPPPRRYIIHMHIEEQHGWMTASLIIGVLVGIGSDWQKGFLFGAFIFLMLQPFLLWDVYTWLRRSEGKGVFPRGRHEECEQALVRDSRVAIWLANGLNAAGFIGTAPLYLFEIFELTDWRGIAIGAGGGSGLALLALAASALLARRSMRDVFLAYAISCGLPRLFVYGLMVPLAAWFLVTVASLFASG